MICMFPSDHELLLIEAAHHGDALEVERLLPLCKKHVIHSALHHAAEAGNYECVKLLSISSTKDENSSALIAAARYGHEKCVQVLIPISNPKFSQSNALRLAAANGNANCVALLIPVSNPKANQSSALYEAVLYGHTQCVKHLIDVSNPKARGSAALTAAVEFGRTQIVDLLYPVSDPSAALKDLQERLPLKPNIWQDLHNRIEAEHLQQTLTTQIDQTARAKSPRKI